MDANTKFDKDQIEQERRAHLRGSLAGGMTAFVGVALAIGGIAIASFGGAPAIIGGVVMGLLGLGAIAQSGLFSAKERDEAYADIQGRKSAAELGDIIKESAVPLSKEQQVALQEAQYARSKEEWGKKLAEARKRDEEASAGAAVIY